MEPVQLHELGSQVFSIFERLHPSDRKQSSGHLNIDERHRLADEEQRFRSWAHSLGLHEQGHTSFDYMMRDVVVVKDHLAELLSEYQENLENLLAIDEGKLIPFEHDDVNFRITSDTRVLASKDSDASSEPSLRETEFRLQGLKEVMNTLYSLAMKMENPRNRPQRTNDQLCQNIPEEIRDKYIKKREEEEIAAAELVMKSFFHGDQEHVDQYSTSYHWLVRRAGIANARRKLQSAYWKNHGLRLSQTRIRSTPLNNVDIDTEENIQWPPAPFQNDASVPCFVCPYCNSSCPQWYSEMAAWRLHLLHDLQAYHCTYEDCRDPYRLYGNREEWISHENQHNLVWHCQHDRKEFKTESEYVEHLGALHPHSNYSSEFVTLMVGPSRKPNRRCPFCRTTFSESIAMQKHIASHLERLALSALPTIESNSGRPIISLSDHEAKYSSLNRIAPSEEFPAEYVKVTGKAALRTRQVGLDDPRVRLIRDRGEGDYGHAGSHTSHHSTRYTPVSGDIDDVLETMAVELDESRVVCALDSNKIYIPRRKLSAILTSERVRTIVNAPCFREHPDKNKLMTDICFGPTPCLKLLAVLIGIGKAHDLPKHMSDGLNDKCLPMDIETSAPNKMYCQHHKEYHPTINMYPRSSTRWEFSRWSYSLSALYITRDHYKHSHYILDHGDVFPMEVGRKMYDQEMPKADYGGFSEVFQVKIDSSHYDFGNAMLRNPSGFFALKRLTTHDRGSFNLELASLLYSMDNAHSEEAHTHSIQRPLATFEVLDPVARVTTYYLLFDWAEGNLKDFWKANQDLVGDMNHSLWMSQQLHEICLALQCVHDERMETLKFTDTTTLAKGPTGRSSTIDELYGRHGDIKPDNFLWFHPEKPSSDLLTLSDFGLGRLHTQVSRSNQDPRNLARPVTYVAPEFDLENGLITRASDIFSLGCVFLEHVTWFLCGSDSVESQFPDQRRARDIYGFEADKFFDIVSNEHGVQEPFLKPQVKDWVKRLQQHKSCNRYLYQLLEIIRDKMLEPDPERRIHILPLIKKMLQLRQTCEHDGSFYLNSVQVK